MFFICKKNESTSPKDALFQLFENWLGDLEKILKLSMYFRYFVIISP